MFSARSNLLRTLRHAVCLALAALAVSGCDREKILHSKTLERNSLMEIVFPGWKKDGPARIREVELPESGAAKGASSKSTTRADIEPMYVVRLDDRHAVMLTHTLPVGTDNEPMTCHACTSFVGAYFFEQDDAGWRLSGQQDDAVQTGVSGSLGETKIVQFGSLGYVFASEWGSCWQGYCGSWLTLARLQPGRVSVLADGIPTAAENTGAYEDCAARLKGEAIPSAPDEDQAPAHECFDVSGSWKPDGEALKFDFRSTSSSDDEGPASRKKDARETAVYRIRNGTFALDRGKNPVPRF